MESRRLPRPWLRAPSPTALDRIAKFFPGEVIAFYAPAVAPAAKAAEDEKAPLPGGPCPWQSILFAVDFLATFLLTRRSIVSGGKPKWTTQTAVPCVAFVLSSYGIKGPWGPECLGLYNEVAARLVMSSFTVLMATISSDFLDRS